MTTIADKAVRASESRGHYPNTVRIGRPVVVYDQRAKFSYDMASYDKAMNERRNSGYDEVGAKEVAPAVEDHD